MKQLHKINGKSVQVPKNHQELSIEINFDNDSTDRQVNIVGFEWVDKEAQDLLDYFNLGMSGGAGVFEGVPHKITLQENGSSLDLFDGYIDLSSANWGRNQVVADSTPVAKIDWLNDIADSFTFDYLREIDKIKDSDFVFVPYVVSSVPNYSDSMITTVTIVFCTVEIEDAFNQVTAALGKIGTGWEAVGGVIELIFRILYALLLIVTILNLILDLIALIIQKIKYKPAMSVNRLIEIACDFKGLTYTSDFLFESTWSKLHIIPESFSNPADVEDDRILGFFAPNRKEQNGYFQGTFGDLLRAIKDTFNAKVVINGKQLSIEKRNKKLTTARFKLPQYDVENWKTNAEEVVSSYLVSFSYDSVEKQTINNWTGNNMQAILDLKVSTDPTLKLLKNLNQVQSPFARATRKTTFTIPEKIADALLDDIGVVVGVFVNLANGVISVVNKAIKTINKLKSALSVIGIKIKADFDPVPRLTDPGLENLIDNRIGMMLLDTDMISVPKLVLLDVNSNYRLNKISALNDTKLTAVNLFNEFHISNTFAPTANSAQRYEFEYDQVEMNLTDVQNVIEDRAVKLPSGEIVEVVSCNWNPFTRLATFVVRQRKLFTNNLKQVILEPVGR
tara:strand:- start:3246 stop:5102 length:1857 start_codon:yes stop_codon:yes gene_type:complete